MFIFRERTTLQVWKSDRVAFMTCVFSDLIASEYKNFVKGIKKYKMDPLLLEYGKGELPSHGRTQKLWNVDVDRMYFPVWEVEVFKYLVPHIVKAVQSLRMQKHLNITPYTGSYVPVCGLNRGNCHSGMYTLNTSNTTYATCLGWTCHWWMLITSRELG
ncbi:hypothetical protein DY000_02007325 [Brassica cretica]|uniref:Uncharacterized protein n=1 Tax=Brassica cretica TaxID=69181 RepID=A0ABQ7CDN4_BRACR|nr:hypothetical protein DY000_02007325 [Brassica cretica]